MVKAKTTHTPPATITGQEIASIALKDKGHPYIWGVWDCSGAVNHWLSEAGLAIPGYTAGGFKGPPPHGPVVLQYVTWKGASTLPGGQSPGPGDLCVWPGALAGGHIGIALGANTMISALDSQSGTVVTPIHGYGPAGVNVMFRRVNAVEGGAGNILAPGCLTGTATGGLIVLGGLIGWLVAGRK